MERRIGINLIGCLGLAEKYVIKRTVTYNFGNLFILDNGEDISVGGTSQTGL